LIKNLEVISQGQNKKCSIGMRKLVIRLQMPGYSMKRYEVVRAQSSENIKD
jgi:hypothetical protein